MNIPQAVLAVRDAVHRRPRMSLIVGWIAVAISLALAPLGIALALADARSTTPALDRVLNAAIGLTFGPVGLVIAARHRENAIGWILIWLGLSIELAAAASGAASVFAGSGVADLIATLGDASWVAILTLLWSLVLLYPDGRLPSRRWRPVGWAVPGWLALFAVSVVLWEIAAPASLHGGAPIPPGPLGLVAQITLGAALVLAVPLVLGIGAAAVTRWRRSVGVERQQLEVFAYMVSVVVLGWVLVATGLPGPWLALRNVALLGLPVAVATAIFRYRLYDIDVVIERTLVYGLTTGAIGVTFFGGIVVLQSALGAFTGGSELAIAASTLLSLALLQPVRRRAQSTVDRRFYRSRYDAGRTLDAFTLRLANEVDLDAVGAELTGAVAATVRPTHVSLWLRATR